MSYVYIIYLIDKNQYFLVIFLLLMLFNTYLFNLSSKTIYFNVGKTPY